MTGPPGAGKSTFVEALGKILTGKGFKVAVMCIGKITLINRSFFNNNWGISTG